MTSMVLAVVPVMLIILVGLLAGYTLSLQSQTLSQLTLYILYPAIILNSFYQTTISFANAKSLLISYIVTYCLIYLSINLVSKITRFPPSSKTAFLASILFPNNGNMGLPIIAFTLGEKGLEIAIIYMICSTILMFCLGPILLQKKTFLYGVRRALALPLVWSILIGIVWRISSLEVPPQLYAGIEKLGEAAIPVALLLLGIQLGKTRWQFGGEELISVAMRLLLAPSIAYLVGTNLNLDNLYLQVLVLQTGMPTAVSSVVLIHEFEGNTNFVARTIIMSTLMSFITIPVITWLLSH